MKLTMTIMISMFFALSAIACPGGEPIALNDSKVLTAYSVKDTVKNIDYMFSDDLEGNELGMSYTISDSKGIETHRIILAHMTGNRVSVIVVDLETNKMRFFKGQYGMMRGCNEIVEYTPEVEEI